MKNEFKINGEETIIYTKRPDREILEILIDTYDLEKVKSFPNSWTVAISRENYIVRGTYREEGKKKQIPLKQFILDVDIIYDNMDPLDDIMDIIIQSHDSQINSD